jgi:hypothetical protein
MISPTAGRARGRLMLALTVIGLIVLEIRQQLHAELLLQRWSGS